MEKDKIQKRWEAKTFMSMVAVFIAGAKAATFSNPNKLIFSMPGFPLPIPRREERSPEIKNRKKFMRTSKRSRIKTRGWA